MIENAPISRQSYAIAMWACCALAVGGGLLIANAAGAPGESLVPIALVLLGCASLTVIPSMGPPMVSSDRWGLVVMAASAGRTMIALMGMLVLLEIQHHPRKPVVYALLAGAVLMMVCESVIAVRLLAKRERERKLFTAVTGVSPTPATSGSGSSV